jgi:hypothetical protein
MQVDLIHLLYTSWRTVDRLGSAIKSTQAEIARTRADIATTQAMLEAFDEADRSRPRDRPRIARSATTRGSFVSRGVHGQIGATPSQTAGVKPPLGAKANGTRLASNLQSGTIDLRATRPIKPVINCLTCGSAMTFHGERREADHEGRPITCGSTSATGTDSFTSATARNLRQECNASGSHSSSSRRCRG